MPRTPELDTAMHVVKGAVVTLFDAPLTTTVHFSPKADSARIVVEYNGEAPTPAHRVQLQELVNQKIKEDVAIETEEIARGAGEAKYKNALVNKTHIYDKNIPPESVTSLKIVKIKDWNINSCPFAHCAKTGAIGTVLVKNIKHRPVKAELEVNFEMTTEDELAKTLANMALEDEKSAAKAAQAAGKKADKKGDKKAAAPAASTSAPKAAAGGKIARPNEHIKPPSLWSIEESLVAAVLKNVPGSADMSEEAKKKVLAASRADVEGLLTVFRNSAYSSGFVAGKTPVSNQIHF
eukprot:GFYU01012658.1.p1 GENE.GFYU01012658.1~~GFYU01012658.1.p1  ORF type:complete len:307 (-),score=84.18 GFYU01012658.1:55-933(-)